MGRRILSRAMLCTPPPLPLSCPQAPPSLASPSPSLSLPLPPLSCFPSLPLSPSMCQASLPPLRRRTLLTKLLSPCSFSVSRCDWPLYQCPPVALRRPKCVGHEDVEEKRKRCSLPLHTRPSSSQLLSCVFHRLCPVVRWALVRVLPGPGRMDTNLLLCSI